MIKISPASQLRGRIVLPASKSISNRVLLINALSGNRKLPDNLSDSDDTYVMLRALESAREGGRGVFDIGAAGTAMRFLTAYLSVTAGEHVITGTERMCHRPISVLVDALRQLGATITYEGEEGFPPLRIVGHEGLEGGELTVPGDVSSQFVSALLMIAPTFHNGLRLTLTGQIASRPYLDMTIAMMRDYGAKVEWVNHNIIEVQPVPYQPHEYHIESDWSAASYWYEMVALSDDRDAQVDLVGLHHDSIQGDSEVCRLFNALGIETRHFVEPDGTEIVRIRKGGSITSYFNYDFTHQPDLAQTFAVTCAMLDVPFRLCGLQSLRIKETDRIAALMKELGKMVQLEEKDSEIRTPSDSLSKGRNEFKNEFKIQNSKIKSFPIEGEDANGPLVFDTYEDHRMAMALAPVCLRTKGWIGINNPQVVSKSYPGFWDDLKKVGFGIKTPSNSPIEGEKLEASPLRGGLVGSESSWCCGLHEVCEKDALRAVREDIEYYEDEELDRFRGRTTYSEEEVEEFREVLYTMRADEVAGWMHSLELRQVNLPDELKDEAFLLIDH